MKTFATLLLSVCCLTAKGQTFLTISVTNSIPTPQYNQGYLVGWSYSSTNSFQVPSNSIATLAGAYGNIFGSYPQFFVQFPTGGTNEFYWQGSTPLPGAATVQFSTSGGLKSNEVGIVVIRFDRVRTVHPGQRVP